MVKYCPECGTELKEGDMFCSSCGATVEHIEKAEVGKRFCPKCGAELVEGVEFCSSCGARISGINMEMASAGARFGSYIIDSIITIVIAFVLEAVFWIVVGGPDMIGPDMMASLLTFLNLLIMVGYFTYFFGNGQTPGMKMARIKLCGTDGTYPIGYGKGFIRWIGMNISGLIAGLGFFWILIDENKQGWHDKMADTYVVVE